MYAFSIFPENLISLIKLATVLHWKNANMLHPHGLFCVLKFKKISIYKFYGKLYEIYNTFNKIYLKFIKNSLLDIFLRIMKLY